MKYIFIFFISLSSISIYSQNTLFNKTYDLDLVWNWTLGLVKINHNYFVLNHKLGFSYSDNQLVLLNIADNGDLQNSFHILCTDSSICSPGYQGLIYDSENTLLIYGEYREHPDSLADGFIARYDILNDNIIEFHRYGGNGTQGFLDLKKHPNGGYIACGGNKAIDGSGDIYAMRLDDNLEVIWESTIAQNGFQFAYTIDIIEDNGYFIVGKGLITLGTAQIIAMKIDDYGQLEWHQLLGGEGNNDGRHTGKVLNDGNLLVAASKGHSSSDKDPYLCKLSDSGEIIWEKSFQTGGNQSFSTNILELFDGSLVVGGGKYVFGTRYSSITKLSEEGEPIWEQLYHGRLPIDSYFYGINQLENNKFIAYGSAWGNNPETRQDGWIVTMDSEGQSCDDSPDCLLVNIAEVEASGEAQLTVSPNPANDQALLYYYLPKVLSNCSIEVYDLNGRLVFSESHQQASQEYGVQLDVSAWPSGMYVVQLRSEEGVLLASSLW
jgi:hypothetical protein